MVLILRKDDSIMDTKGIRKENKIMRLIIEISEGQYKNCCETWACNDDAIHQIVYRSIAEGIPLPEAHGRLGDLDELEERIRGFINNDKDYVSEKTLIREQFILDGIKETRTIIEANE